MGTAGITELTSLLADYMAELQEQQQEELGTAVDLTSALVSTVKTDTVTLSDAAYAKSHNSNIMSRNFVGGYTRDASYLDAQSAGNAAVQNLQNSMQSSMGSLLETTAFWYGSARMQNAKTMKDTTEAHEKVFAEQKARIEQKAAEAMAPKDENGEPIQQVPAASSAAAAAGSTAQTEAPKVEINIDGVAAAAKALSSIDVSV